MSYGQPYGYQSNHLMNREELEYAHRTTGVRDPVMGTASSSSVPATQLTAPAPPPSSAPASPVTSPTPAVPLTTSTTLRTYQYTMRDAIIFLCFFVFMFITYVWHDWSTITNMSASNRTVILLWIGSLSIVVSFILSQIISIVIGAF